MIKFIGSKTWMKNHPKMADIPGLCCLSGRKEYVVEGPEEIIEQLKLVPNNSFLFQKMKVLIDFLESKGIEYSIEGKSASI